jgi:3D (Asp-Asp-Asp) domain-containing protein
MTKSDRKEIRSRVKGDTAMTIRPSWEDVPKWLIGIATYKVHLIPILFIIALLASHQSDAKYEETINELEQELSITKSTQDNLVKEMFGVDKPNVKSLPVTVTSYNPVKRQCDNTPFETASGAFTTPGMLAVSRDLMKRCNWKFGQKVVLKDYGTFTVTDYMNKRFKNRVDIISFIPNWSEKFGLRKTIVYYHKG